MSHNHHNHSHSDSSGKNLLFAILLNFLITIVEIIGGIFSNSLSLLSDALHNFGDTFAILLAYLANRISNKKATTKRTFGFKRIEILAALFNSVSMILICLFLFFQAYQRLMMPQHIEGKLMFFIATIGFLANLYAVIILKKDSHKNINYKAAYLHLLGDTLSSVMVIIGSILIIFFKIYWLDPIVTIVIGIYILKEAIGILRQTYLILMQATPADLDLIMVKKLLEEIPEIHNIHHIHAWNLTDKKIIFDCHVDLKDDLRTSQTSEITKKIKLILEKNFNITHLTIQYEFDCCGNKEIII